nr:MAG TPA: hypothetical protein [Caudoviricetes sp.]DAO13849.1 MAG TPA: hypothetical protein [Caudoviricetes sp.]DAT09827.1 MAG TPA: hypothetical protein [Caudoviricetes sp.]
MQFVFSFLLQFVFFSLLLHFKLTAQKYVKILT